jgi:hypothetical protein
MTIQIPIAKQTIPRQQTTANEWIVPDTVDGLRAEVGLRQPPLVEPAPAFEFRCAAHSEVDVSRMIRQFVGALKVPQERTVVLPGDPAQAIWVYHTIRRESSSATTDAPKDRRRRFDVDPKAASALIDWALAQRFDSDDAEQIRDDAWH